MPTTGPEAQPMRLQKFLAHCGISSRRAAEVHILKGRIRVNGQIVTALGTRVTPGTDTVEFDGKKVALPQSRGSIYIAVNKPRGIITSCAHRGEKIILDLVPVKERVYPVGRLDKDSEGLVLLTNDGGLHNRLSHPSHNHEKEYVVKTRHPVKEDALRAMARGIVIDGEKTRKARVRRISKTEFNMVLQQGRNRQIRKMVGKTGNQVIRLKRIRMANIRLAGLKPGSWRHLTKDEIENLTQS